MSKGQYKQFDQQFNNKKPVKIGESWNIDNNIQIEFDVP